MVGWGEIAQFVCGQAMSLKPQLYIEAARAAGTRAGRILAHFAASVGAAANARVFMVRAKGESTFVLAFKIIVGVCHSKGRGN